MAVFRSNKGMETACSRAGGLVNFVGGVEHGLLFKQSTGHRQQAVGDGAQGAAVAVAALAQRGITAAAERVVLGCQARPMIERVREPLIAGVTAYDDAGFAAAAGHRGHPGQASIGGRLASQAAYRTCRVPNSRGRACSKPQAARNSTTGDASIACLCWLGE